MTSASGTGDLGPPPRDPRDSWDLPPTGQLPTIADLDEVTTRVLAPNPSPMTLDGTNTYVLAAADGDTAIIVDPGPPDAAHLQRVQDVLRGRDAAVHSIVVTHHHRDHAEAATDWAEVFTCRVVAADPTVAGPGGRLVGDGDHIDAGELHLEVIATPGHTRDHLSLRSPTGAVLTGDHVLGRGTSVVSYPDGDLTAYLDSLRRLLRLGPDVLHPGHGPALTHDAGTVLAYYQQHRAYRQAQVLAALEQGPTTPAELVARIYTEVPRHLRSAAETSTRATLAALEQQGRVHLDGQNRARLLD